MIHRMDPPVDPERRPVPEDLRPMTATTAPLPTGRGWAYEPRWRGLRVLAFCEPGRVAMVDEGGVERTASFPELRPIGRATGSTEVVLDGVITALSGADDLVGRRSAAKSDSTRRRLARVEPVTLVLFDALWLDGHPLTDRPWDNRREVLDGLALTGPAWATPAAFLEGGRDLLAAAPAQGLTGVVAKRRASAYQPGARSTDWIDARA